VSVTSSARYAGRPIDPDDPHLERGYGPWVAYCNSKLANLHFALELQARLAAAGSGVRSLTGDPGFSATDLQAHSAREAGGWSQRFFHSTVRLFGTTPAAGALSQLRGATDPDAPGGALYGLRFLVRGAPVRRRLLPLERRQSARTTLWQVSERETGVTFDVGAIVSAAR
jgi:NAD(P)-dependent dehydrogenase (short-subunit alcohol dehydrogenase family)